MNDSLPRCLRVRLFDHSLPLILKCRYRMALFAAFSILPAILSAQWTVNTANRAEVRQFYKSIYFASESPTLEWTGNFTTGDAGTTSAAFQESVRLRINFFRALVGVPADIVFDPALHASCQQAALMMSVNRALSHNPPNTWQFWTAAGAEAASKANIYLGFNGSEAVNGYVKDNGINNTAVGHRRWFFYPQSKKMATGDVPADSVAGLRDGNAIWVVDTDHFNDPRPATRDDFVAWPPPGYTPYNLLSARWSFSYPEADFSTAIVSVTKGGQAVSVIPEEFQDGSGENTIVWKMEGLDPAGSGQEWPRPNGETTYAVSVQNVKIGSQTRDFNYQSTVFDPAAHEPADQIPLSGPAIVARGTPRQYSLPAWPGADGLRWQVFQSSPGGFLDDAESGATRFSTNITNTGTQPAYPVTVATSAPSGAHAFHLTQFNNSAPQSLTLAAPFLVTAQTQISWQSKIGFATTVQKARLEVSDDVGRTWTTVWEKAGVDSPPVDNAWQLVEVNLGAFAGRLVTVRFIFAVVGAGSYYADSKASVGWLFDDVRLTGAEIPENPQERLSANGLSFQFTPNTLGTFRLMATPYLYDMAYGDWSAIVDVNVLAGPQDLFADAEIFENGWAGSARFGYFTWDNWPWMLHYDHGWVYFAGSPQMWFLYDPGLGGWIFTSQQAYPFMYDFNRAAWLQFNGRDSTNRVFYRYGDQEGWIFAP